MKNFVPRILMLSAHAKSEEEEEEEKEEKEKEKEGGVRLALFSQLIFSD